MARDCTHGLLKNRGTRHDPHTVQLACGTMTDLLLKLFDLLFGGLVKSVGARRALASQFESLKRQVLYESITNNLPVRLHHLRAFLIEHGLVDRPGIQEFFLKWLDDPVVVMGVAAIHLHSKKEVDALREDVVRLRLR